MEKGTGSRLKFITTNCDGVQNGSNQRMIVTSNPQKDFSRVFGGGNNNYMVVDTTTTAKKPLPKRPHLQVSIPDIPGFHFNSGASVGVTTNNSVFNNPINVDTTRRNYNPIGSSNNNYTSFFGSSGPNSTTSIMIPDDSSDSDENGNSEELIAGLLRLRDDIFNKEALNTSKEHRKALVRKGLDGVNDLITELSANPSNVDKRKKAQCVIDRMNVVANKKSKRVAAAEIVADRRVDLSVNRNREVTKEMMELDEKEIELENKKTESVNNNNSERDSSYCIICEESRWSVFLSPCLHAQFCVKCSWNIKDKTKKCPVCSAEVENAVKLFF